MKQEIKMTKSQENKRLNSRKKNAIQILINKVELNNNAEEKALAILIVIKAAYQSVLSGLYKANEAELVKGLTERAINKRL